MLRYVRYTTLNKIIEGYIWDRSLRGGFISHRYCAGYCAGLRGEPAGRVSSKVLPVLQVLVRVRRHPLLQGDGLSVSLVAQALEVNEVDIAIRALLLQAVVTELASRCATNCNSRRSRNLAELAELAAAVASVASALGVLSTHTGAHLLEERAHGHHDASQAGQAEHGPDLGEAACDEGDVGLDDGPEETVRGYADDVVGGHAHDVLFVEGGGRCVLLDADDHANNGGGNGETSE